MVRDWEVFRRITGTREKRDKRARFEGVDEGSGSSEKERSQRPVDEKGTAEPGESWRRKEDKMLRSIGLGGPLFGSGVREGKRDEGMNLPKQTDGRVKKPMQNVNKPVRTASKPIPAANKPNKS